jgi:hypothetical protein
MVRCFDSTRRGSASMPDSDGMDASAAVGVGNEVCGCWCDDTGNGVCGRRGRRVASLRRGVVPPGDWWRLAAPVGLGVETRTALAGLWYWNQGMSGLLPVPLHPLGTIGIWSGNKGWFA